MLYCDKFALPLYIEPPVTTEPDRKGSLKSLIVQLPVTLPWFCDDEITNEISACTVEPSTQTIVPLPPP